MWNKFYCKWNGENFWTSSCYEHAFNEQANKKNQLKQRLINITIFHLQKNKSELA